MAEVVGRNVVELGLFADPSDQAKLMEAVRNGAGKSISLGSWIKGKREIPHEDTIVAKAIRYCGQDCLLAMMPTVCPPCKNWQALHQSHDRFRTILNNITECYYEVDLGGRITFFNDAVVTLLGHTSDELIGLSYKAFMPPEDARRLQEAFNYILEGKCSVKLVEHKIHCKDGTMRLVETSTSLLHDHQGNPVGFFGLLRDRTQLLQSRKMEAVGTLAGGIAHDFNNLLMGIKGHATIALMDLDKENPLYEKLAAIEQYVMAGTELTRQLLDTARVGKYEVKPTDLNELIDKNAELFGRTKKEVRIHRNFEQALWTVEVDRGQMEQVLLNLFVNAWQAMPKGGDLFLETQNVALDKSYVEQYGVPPGKYVKLSVTDTGPGIDPKNLKRIFDPFFTTKSSGAGTGLGLSTACGIITNHGGFITVASELDKGATFHICLPATDRRTFQQKEQEKQIYNGDETLLFVDDEEGLIEVGSILLERLGYTVIAAHSGEEAVQIYRQQGEQIDLVLVDMIMPGMSGSDTFNALKAINPSVKVILSSGYSVDGQARDIIDRGCNGFIQKPFGIHDLSAKLRQVLDPPDKAGN